MKKSASFLALAVSSSALAACGGGGSSSSADTTASTDCPSGNQISGSAPETVTVKADPSGDPSFTQSGVDASAGKISLVLDNPSSSCHDLAVKDKAGKNYGATENKVKKGKTNVVLDLQPGKYFYYSTVPGEEEAGMLGTLTVN
jgi:uncharacterized cupredoxin-like copper-binding protein